MATNTTVNVTSIQPPVIVKQGPPELALWYLDPPAWVNPSLKVLGFAVVLLVVYRLYQRGWEIDPATQYDMQIVVASIAMILSATLTMVNWFEYPYVADVAVGFLVGYGVVLAAQTRLLPIEWGDLGKNTSDRLAITWGLLALLTAVLPAVARSHGKGMQLMGGRLIIVGIAVAMMLYNAIFNPTAE